jgi:hypothetical protein
MCLIINAMPENAQAKVEHNKESITALLVKKYQQDALNGTVASNVRTKPGQCAIVHGK